VLFKKWNDNQKPKKKSEKRELGKDWWYSQMVQAKTGCSTWDRFEWDRRVSMMGGTGWDWDRGVFRLGGTGWDWDRWAFRLGGTGWDWDKGVFQLNQSTCPKVRKVGLKGRENAGFYTCV